MKQAELLDKDWSLIMKIMYSYQQVNDYDCSLYAIKNVQAVINHQDWSKIIKNTSWINAFNYLYNTVIQNWGWIEEEVVQLSQKRTVRCFSELNSLVRSQISLLSEASSDITTPPVLSVLMRQLNSSNVIPPQQELHQSERNKECKKH